jgi:hypothetical protein
VPDYAVSRVRAQCLFSKNRKTGKIYLPKQQLKELQPVRQMRFFFATATNALGRGSF